MILRPPNPVCLLSMLLAAEGREHRERTQRGDARRKEAQADERGDFICMIPLIFMQIKNVVHDIPLALAVAYLTVAPFSFPEKCTPPRQALCGA